MVISGWVQLVGFSDFQKVVLFGSKLANRVLDLPKKAEWLSVPSQLMSWRLFVCDSIKRQFMITPPLFCTSKLFALTNKQFRRPVNISYMLQEQIDYDEKETREALT